MFPGDVPKKLAVVWLSITPGMCFYRVCKQSLIAKMDGNRAHVFLAFWTVKRLF